MSKKVIIQASSRSKGNTSNIVDVFQSNVKIDVIDLNTKKINHFDYEFRNSNDDFKILFKQIVNDYDVILFATPIYWYTMSGILKVFLDRISDFLFQEREYARLMNGKKMGVISCGSDSEVFKGFDMPFEQTAKYLKMNYTGHIHTWLENGNVPNDVSDLIEDYITRKIN